MKTPFLSTAARVSCLLVAASAFAENASAPSGGSTSQPPQQPAAAARSSDKAETHTGATTFGNQTDPAAIATPPPAPRSETKTESPSANHVWVRGHYQPVKGEWKWVPGVWAIPATPQSVWIEGSYDPNAKRWSEGHWQPDGIPTKTDTVQPSGPPKK